MAWTRRIRPSEMPSWSAWITARTKFESSVASTRSAILRSATVRVSPTRISLSIERELVDQRAFHVLDQLRDRAVEAEARLDADGEQIERVRQLAADRVAAAAGLRSSRKISGPMRPIAAPTGTSRMLDAS